MRVDEKERLESYEPTAGALERRKLDVLGPLGFPGEEAGDLLAYWQAILKRRWTILTVLFVTFTPALVWTLKQERIYRSEALIEIGKSRELVNMKDLVASESEENPMELDTQIQILQSKTLARHVINDLRLDRLPEFNPLAGGPQPLIRQPSASEATLKIFLSGLEVQPIKGSRLVWVAYEYKDPELAARIANALAKNFIEQNLEAHWQAAQVASEWLSQKLNETKIDLEKTEEKLQAYARENGLFFLVSKPDEPEALIAERLHRLQEELGKAETERFKEEWLGQLSQKDIYTASAVPGIFENAVTTNIETRLTELKSKRAEMLATFTPDYPKVKQLQFQVDELEKMLVQERKRVAESTAQGYNAIRTRENLLRQALADQQGQANAIAERAVQYNILKRQVDTNRELYNGLLQHLKETGVSASMKASTIRIVDAAEPAKIPVKPRVALNLLLGFVLGLGLGIAVALLQETLDNSVKNSDDVERFFQLPSLALVPAVGSLEPRRGFGSGLYPRAKLLAKGAGGSAEEQLTVTGDSRTSWHRIDQEEKQHSPLVEAFRNLRTSILLSAADRPPRTLLVCSAQPGEGKTTVTINLAISLAQLGERVLIIDGDLRRPSVHQALGIQDGVGLVHYLIGQREWKAVVQPTGVPGVDALVCGPIPPNPAELLASDRMRNLVREAAEAYNFVVLDSPPVLTMSDSRILMPLVEAVILVVAGGITPRQLVQRARSQAREVGGNLVGVVLNRIDVRNEGYYGYYYYRDYSNSSERKASGKT